MRLKALLNDTDAVLLNGATLAPACLEQEIELVTLDSRKAKPGVLFAASKGATSFSKDGHNYLGNALEQEVSALIVENPSSLTPAQLSSANLPIWVTANSRALAAKLAEKLHGCPSASLSLCGVTGTNGKTTVTYLTSSIAEAMGKKSAVVGTLGIGHPGALKASGFTTPEAESLSQALKELKREGYNHVSMEVSSIALSTHRVDGVVFRAGAFTNLSVDHLDFHGDMEQYRLAKNRFFLELLPKDAPAILPEQHELVEMLKKGAHPVLTWGISPDADIRASEVNQSAQGLRFTLMLGGQERSVQSQLFGTFNVDNMLCAAGLAHATGASIDDIANGLANAGAPPGRLERVHVKNMQGKPAVIVDFAHTPDALERTLVALRAAASERLIVVFGCGGNRDKGKRPQMGHIASTFADLIFVTDDNPRHESPEQIRQEVLSGIDAPSLSRCFNVGDRRLAIARAIDMANPKDLVVIAGKGHETTQQIGDEYLPFHDLSIAKSALEEWHR